MILNELDLERIIKDEKKKIAIITVIALEQGTYGICNGFSLVYDQLKTRENLRFLPLRVSSGARRVEGFEVLEDIFLGNFYYAREDAERIAEFSPDIVLMSVLFSKTLPVLVKVLMAYLPRHTYIIFGGPGAVSMIYVQSEEDIRKEISRQSKIYLYPFDLDRLDLLREDTKFSLYLDSYNPDIFDKDSSLELTVPYSIDICHKMLRYGRCEFCSYTTALLSKLAFTKPRKLSNELRNIEVPEYIFDRNLAICLVNKMSGPTIHMALKYFNDVSDFLAKCESFSAFSAVTFTHDFTNILERNATLCKGAVSKQCIINFGVETLIEEVRKDIKKDYVSSREVVKYIIETFRYTDFKIFLNFILNIRPITKSELLEFEKNLLEILEEASKYPNYRLGFLVNIDCDYFSVKSIESVRKGRAFEYTSVGRGTYAFYRNENIIRLKQIFERLKKKYNVNMVDVSNDARKDILER